MPDCSSPSDFFPLPPKSDPGVGLSCLKSRISVAAVFNTYLRTGDRFRTAAAHNLSVEEVTDLATHENWDALLGQRRKLTEEGGATKTTEDTNRELVRLQIASQADRARNEINLVLDHLESLAKDDKLAYLFEIDRTGKRTPTAKLYLDLTKAIATLAEVSLRAEGDQLPARPESDGVSGNEFAKSLGLGLAKGVAELAAGASRTAPAKPIVTL